MSLVILIYDIENIKLSINSKYYSYDIINGNKAIIYDIYSRFQSSLVGSDAVLFDKIYFLQKTPLFGIDCSKQVIH